jgi:hypothetical protein
MMKNNDHQFKDIIRSLERMKLIKPDAEFRSRIDKRMNLSPASRRLFLPIFVFRAALAAVVLLLVGGTSVMASQDSKPGTFFYPVKKLVETVKTSVIPPVTVSTIPSPQPQSKKLPTTSAPSPTAPLTDPDTQKDSTAEDNIPSAPSQTPTPSPTPEEHSVPPAANKPVDQALTNDPTKLNRQIGGVEIIEPTVTPTPQPINEGSKDSGSDAGAGGTLLPKIKTGL